MPIAKIVGIESRDYTKKETGELKNMTVLHFTYNLKGKGVSGNGADNVFLDIERFDPPKIGDVCLIETDKRGFLSNLEEIEKAVAASPDRK